MEDTGTFDQTECKVHISRALRENGMVKFMVDALNKAGCPWDPDKFTCITCDAPVEAGFDKSNDSVSSISPQCVLLTVGLPVRLKFVGTM